MGEDGLKENLIMRYDWKQHIHTLLILKGRENVAFLFNFTETLKHGIVRSLCLIPLISTEENKCHLNTSYYFLVLSFPG